MDCSPPGSSVRGILQARILEWITISFSRGSSWPRDRTCIAGRFFTILAIGITGWTIKKLINLFKVSQVIRAKQGFKPRKPDSRVVFWGAVWFSSATWVFFPIREDSFWHHKNSPKLITSTLWMHIKIIFINLRLYHIWIYSNQEIYTKT